MSTTEFFLLDKRRKRSFLAFKAALCELLKKKSFDEIFTKEIFELAGYSRAAFYSNYTDKLDLVYKIIDTEIHVFCEYINSIRVKTPISCASRERLRPVASQIFDHAYRNRDVYELIVFKNIIPNSCDYFCSRCYEVSLQDLAKKQFTPPSKQHDNYLGYVINYCYLASIDYWIHENFQSSPKQITDMFCNLFCIYVVPDGESNPLIRACL